MSRTDGKYWRNKYGVYNTRWKAIFPGETKPVKIVFHSNRDYVRVGIKIVFSDKGLFTIAELQGKTLKLERRTPQPVTAYPSASILK